MISESPDAMSLLAGVPADFPDPEARAPRAAATELARLHRPPPELVGALVAVICRDTRSVTLDPAQRLSHFPATPILSLSWFGEDGAGIVRRSEDRQRCWQPYRSRTVLAGSQSAPSTGWSRSMGRAGMILFSVDAARELFGLDPKAIHDQFVDAHGVLDRRWRPLFEGLLAADDDPAVLACLQRELGPRWQALRGRDSMPQALTRFGRDWVERLGWQARQWQRTLGPRQVERRVKAWTGRSLRQWQVLAQTESLFVSARERHEAGQPFDWAGLAQDEGFADQAHMSRATRRISGFSPAEFAQRFRDDESFWPYRLWV